MNNSIHCPICKEKIKKVDNILLRCSFCGLMFRNFPFSENNLGELYKKAWLDIDNEIGGTDIRLARIYAKKLALTLGLSDFSGLKILEFGAGRGYMLTALHELGAQVYAIEPFGCDYLKEKGFQVFKGLDDLPKGILFDGIITIDVLEHLLSPVDEIGKLYQFLRHGGWFFIATPNSNGLSARYYGKNWDQFKNPCHVYLFNDQSIKMVFGMLGYTKFYKLNWFVRYKNNFFIILIHFLLQLLRIDGEIRYLISKT